MSIEPGPSIPSYAMTAINQCEFIGKECIVTKNLTAADSDGVHVFYTFTNDLDSSGSGTITKFQTRTMTPPQWAKYFTDNYSYYYDTLNGSTVELISEFCSALEEASGSPIPAIVSAIATIFMTIGTPFGYNTIGNELSYAYSHSFPNSKLMTVVQKAQGGVVTGHSTTWQANWLYDYTYS